MRFFKRVAVLIFCSCYLSGCHKSGVWNESPENWERAFNGQSKPRDVTIYHSYYWRSPHFTYEAGYFFELSAPEKFLQDWIQYQRLVSMIPSSETFGPYPAQPTWFTPKPMDNYDMWVATNSPNTNFRLFQDRASKRIFVSEAQ
jgi:hypothetical protein